METKIDRMPPTQGATIRYVLAQGRRRGEVRAAIVTNAFDAIRSPAGDVKYRTTEAKLCNGTVFLDELNDLGDEPSERFFGSAHYDGSEAPAPGTWHWPALEGVAVAELCETESVTLDIRMRGVGQVTEDIDLLIGKLGELGRAMAGAGAASVDQVAVRVLEELTPLVDHHLGEQLRRRADKLRAVAR